ncbi:protein YohO [Enterobacteriaceae bacterium LUAb1]
MNWKKISIIALFLMMALGGVGGLMLAGYSIILHAS